MIMVFYASYKLQTITLNKKLVINLKALAEQAKMG
jgi:hypothetical protein